MERFASILPQIMPAALTGQVVQTDGLALLVGDFPAPVGALVAIERQTGDPLQGEVIGFRNAATIVYPLGRLDGIRRGNRVRLLRTARHLRVGHGLLGRVVDADGQALDDGPRSRSAPSRRARPSGTARRGTSESRPAADDRSPIARCVVDLRLWPENGDLLGLGRRQERAVGNDGPLHLCRCQCDRSDR